ncbi:rRNA N6-adenosine-methyltransferase METTL5 isoform X1 [Leptidea sinapis]|uniref:rRNA N6-adenosine-methyltransferase METTL5 isoform X1 n=1 Tax=Leptidea sinapis TaxID=189913 RepID=UPI0021C28FAD|nr:rRNA N6-adenosine-methyltransferase METTL5 isoform X1 [Leptidea sinapis]
MSAVMKLKVIEGHLGSLSGFSKPKIKYEQYETPAHIAAIALYTIQTQFESLENKLVLDAGCGPGMLSVGVSLLGAAAVIAVDIDYEALQILNQNIEETETTNIDAIQCDFLDSEMYRWNNCFDTVVMNPPFGTKNNAGMDMKFLKMGLNLSSDCVYSLHKSSTRYISVLLLHRSHIEKKVREWGVKGEVIAELRYNLESSYKFHKHKSKDIAVDLWRLFHPS